jgi:hypothetical protein
MLLVLVPDIVYCRCQHQQGVVCRTEIVTVTCYCYSALQSTIYNYNVIMLAC